MTAPPPPPPPAYGAPAQSSNNNLLGLLALILGIVSIPLACCGAGILFGAVAAVLGYLGKQKAAQGLATNGGQANAGFITGIVGAVLSILVIIGSFIFNFGMTAWL